MMTWALVGYLAVAVAWASALALRYVSARPLSDLQKQRWRIAGLALLWLPIVLGNAMLALWYRLTEAVAARRGFLD